MFSRDNRGDDLFINSTIDTSQPDKIIIREKEAPRRKVRRRVKKDSSRPVMPAASVNDDEKFVMPRLSEIQKKKDDSDRGFSSDFRASAADWKEVNVPDYSGLDDLSDNSFGDMFKNGFTAVNAMQITAAVLLVAIFISSLMTTNVYARFECRQNRDTAMAQLVMYEDADFNTVAQVVEDVEAPISMEEATPQIGKAVSLVLSSVEKDLKIKLVDENDTLVKDISWSVKVTDGDGNSSDENDDDRDGIIHMTDVKAGDYSVELNPSTDLADFTIPTMAQSVSVKARVEYKVIADIKEEIKTEKEINAAVEDNGNKAADVETSTAPKDTVEWLESTKTLTGEGYVEATPDLTKCVSIKRENLLVSLADKIKTTASASFGRLSIAYPVLLTPHDAGHTLNLSPNSDGTHNVVCSGDPECDENKSNVACDYSEDGGTKCKCGYVKPQEEPKPEDPKPGCQHTETSETTTWNNNDCKQGGKKTITCKSCGEKIKTEDLPANADHDWKDGKCSRCGAVKPAEEKKISLNAGSISLQVGATQNLTATVTPNNLTVEYSSSNTSVATVDSAGKITAVKAGTATITAKIKEDTTKTATCTVTVTEKPVEATLKLATSVTLKVKESKTLPADITPATAKLSAANSVDVAIATVTISNNSIVVTGVKEGTTTLNVASDNGKTATVSVTVTAAYADDAQLYDASKNALYVKEGDSYRLAKYRDYNKDPRPTFYRKQEEYKYTGWQTLEGRTYYYNRDNVPITGDQIIGGVTYHFGTDGALSQGSGTLGIDVSKYQPSINWSSVKASGINYVIIRCGYRGSSTGVLVEDPYFKSHIKGAKAAGLKVGIYFFTTAVSEAEAVEEASMVAYLCKGYGIDYPVFMDCESSPRPGYNGMSAAQRTQIIKAFCNTVRSAGYTPGVYANKTWLTSYMNAGELSGYKIWLAQYNAAGPTYSGRYDLWQYTSKGSVNGISGNVDMNQSYLGY